MTTCNDIEHYEPSAQNASAKCTQFNQQHGAITHFDANPSWSPNATAGSGVALEQCGGWIGQQASFGPEGSVGLCLAWCIIQDCGHVVHAVGLQIVKGYSGTNSSIKQRMSPEIWLVSILNVEFFNTSW